MPSAPPTDIRTLHVLDISTAHLAPETMEFLDSRRKEAWPVIGGHIPYGYFVYAHDEDDPEIPRDLWACFEFAHTNGCSHLRFDAHTAPYAALPTYHD